MPVGLMLRSMTSSELTEWMAYFDLRANPPKTPASTQQLKATLDELVARSSRNRTISRR